MDIKKSLVSDGSDSQGNTFSYASQADDSLYSASSSWNAPVSSLASIGADSGAAPSGPVVLTSGVPANGYLSMEWQINALSQLGLLSRFVGMLTDSRSFVSYVRHEYFRRLLCKLLGEEVAAGLIPADEAALAELVKDICYDNANRYFGLEVGKF